MRSFTRRRFLSIAACVAVAGSGRHEPATAARVTWRGTALGADVSITLDGPEDLTRPALARARLEIDAYEARFSLFRANSELVRLNAHGHLPDLDARWHDMLALCDRLHRETNGLFDPTIQPLWLAYAAGGVPDEARASVGWDRVTLPDAARRGVRLGAGQALSFNGIAQGAATDAVRKVLQAAGMTRVMVDIGEVATLGGPWHLGASDPDQGHFSTVQLDDMAMAVSSPAALRLDNTAHHILHPHGPAHPRWSSVAVIARSAAIADGLSTAACFMDKAALRSCAMRLGGIDRVLLLDRHGACETILVQV
ncbi:FAD:protein FMN transferase [Roseinatronobacter alkalisoli]|uniref:FAD:protein FMN transferase n=1 Tax=Roseinatronobacter alkalisoli TaxID=3028235 RepID=A0ABT5T7R0_9RHOB|nr:FAD:protein FMN transferase [Roseinatronobacter sp. HJB301]MDD7970984.1 FAD:protein FMN transferase [Roseinatronobacter sp. HJB301]